MFNIAINTFREIRRNKYLYVILFFSFVFIVFSIFLSKLTIWDLSKIIIDFWLSMIEIFGLIWVLFVWSQLLFKEIEGKTIFLILSKPIKRYEFILWKFLGFSFLVFLIVFFESLVFLLVLIYENIEITNLIIYSIINTFLKLELALSIVFFFSTFMSNLLIIIITVMIYFISHSFSVILDIANKTGNYIFINATKFLWIIFPPFQALNTKDLIWSFENISLFYFWANLVYSMLYLIIILAFSIFIFNKKNFEN